MCDIIPSTPPSQRFRSATAAVVRTLLENRENLPRLLCVDDQAELLLMLEHFLSSQGFSVATVNNGEEAIDLAASDRFDAVVLDYEMPGMNGEEVARRLKEFNPALPIVLFSACGTDLPE